MVAAVAGYGGSIGVLVTARGPGDSPMLPVGTVPSCLLSVLEGVRSVFTAPTFATFASLVTGLLAATGPRTVTGMWSAAGLAGRSHHARAHRFFSHARWDLDSLGLLVARLVVARFVPAEQAVTVVVDDTLFHRYGSKTHGVFWQHDGSAKGRDGIGRGNCFVVVGLIVTVPFMTRPVCLPVLFRLYIPKSGVSKPDAARVLVGLLARAFPERSIHGWLMPPTGDRLGARCPATPRSPPA
jgi:DDE superfamily endonuclease